MKHLLPAAVLTAVLFSPAQTKTPYEKMSQAPLIWRHGMLVVALIKTDYYCEKVTHSFIQGTDSQDTLFMSVRCAREDGDYLYLEKTDGTATIITCDQAGALFVDYGIDGGCWMPLNDPTSHLKY